MRTSRCGERISHSRYATVNPRTAQTHFLLILTTHAQPFRFHLAAEELSSVVILREAPGIFLREIVPLRFPPGRVVEESLFPPPTPQLRTNVRRRFCGCPTLRILKGGSWCYAAARRIGPACATSRHEAAHRRQASAHFCIVSPSYFPHSAAHASHSSAHTPQMRWANGELPARRTTHVRQSSRHSPQSRMHSLILAGSIVRPSSRHSEHQRKHCRQSSIHRSTVGFEIATVTSCQVLEIGLILTTSSRSGPPCTGHTFHAEP